MYLFIASEKDKWVFMTRKKSCIVPLTSNQINNLIKHLSLINNYDLLMNIKFLRQAIRFYLIIYRYFLYNVFCSHM